MINYHFGAHLIDWICLLLAFAASIWAMFQLDREH